MAQEKAKQLVAQALGDLAAALEEGKSQSLLDYLTMLARFHNYSFGNVLLIVSQNPRATHVAGFRTWQKHGRFVRKGEKGIVIRAPMLVRDQDATGTDDTPGNIRFKAAYVFDVSQPDGEELPAPAKATGDPGTHTEKLQRFAASRNISVKLVKHTEQLEGALGTSSGGRIRILQGLQPAEEFSVFAHELEEAMASLLGFV